MPCWSSCWARRAHKAHHFLICLHDVASHKVSLASWSLLLVLQLDLRPSRCSHRFFLYARCCLRRGFHTRGIVVSRVGPPSWATTLPLFTTSSFVRKMSFKRCFDPGGIVVAQAGFPGGPVAHTRFISLTFSPQVVVTETVAIPESPCLPLLPFCWACRARKLGALPLASQGVASHTVSIPEA